MKVLLLCQLDPSAERRLLESGRAIAGRTVAECVADGTAAEVEAVVVRSGISVDRAMLDALPNLRRVVRAGSGLDAIDLPELERRRIRLARNPELSASAVAELALGALISLARRLPEAEALLLRGTWAKSRLVGEAPSSLSVAIWGGGPVGRACALALRPHTRDVAFADWPSLDRALERRSPEQLLSEADVHVLCLPLRDTTRGAWGRERLAQVAARRPYLINVARKELLDAEAAVAALSRGELRGAFIDPIDEADLPAMARLKREAGGVNLLLSQHLGAQRADVHRDVGRWVLEVLGM